MFAFSSTILSLRIEIADKIRHTMKRFHSNISFTEGKKPKFWSQVMRVWKEENLSYSQWVSTKC